MLSSFGVRSPCKGWKPKILSCPQFQFWLQFEGDCDPSWYYISLSYQTRSLPDPLPAQDPTHLQPGSDSPRADPLDGSIGDVITSARADPSRLRVERVMAQPEPTLSRLSSD